MEEAFEKLKKEGKTDVDSLIKWMKDWWFSAKILEDAQAAEQRARTYLADAADRGAVELDQFKEALGKLAAEQKKNVDELKNMLADQKPKFMSALKAGVSAFKEALTKKEE